MTASVCPYCRAPIDSQTGDELVCAGCGTPHHADCYAENRGCTVFGCSAAPAEEPKVHLTGSELANPGALPPVLRTSSIPGVAPPPSADPAVRVKAPPPPLPGVAAPQPVPVPRFGAASVLFGAQPVAAVAMAAPSADLVFEPGPEAKNRTTFIILGVLLGPFGAHNFYAGYRRKAIAQLLITVLTVGFASPMTWIWAVIDVCTVDRDSTGSEFRS